MEHRARWSLSALMLGGALLAASLGGRQSTRPWTVEQARTYNEASTDLYRLSYEAVIVQEMRASNSSRSVQSRFGEHVLGNNNGYPADAAPPIDPRMATPERTTAQLAAAKTRYEQVRADLDGARSRAGSPVGGLMWPGVGLIVAGILGSVYARLHES